MTFCCLVFDAVFFMAASIVTSVTDIPVIRASSLQMIRWLSSIRGFHREVFAIPVSYPLNYCW